ncbi:protein kinase [Aureococcus anophagefferens]|uniref:Protein kinase n=2 Tax=Aureococcus anophagefferens TaxID=44056 RepID=A0ABR1FM95_AURAN
MPRSRSRSRDRGGRRRRSRSRDRRDRRDDRDDDRKRHRRDDDRATTSSSLREKEKAASRKRKEEKAALAEYDVLAADDGIVVDEDELRAFEEDGEDEEAAEARRAAERKARGHQAAPRARGRGGARGRRRRRADGRRRRRRGRGGRGRGRRPTRPRTPATVASAVAEREARDKAVHYKVTAMGLAEERPATASFDMFGDAPVEAAPGDGGAAKDFLGKRATAAQLLAGELGDEEQANWDDTEGYYMARPGEVIDGRYRVLGVVGRGVFSSVLKARDVAAEAEDDAAGKGGSARYVAVKMIRNNDTMKNLASKEIELLKLIAEHDGDSRYHCVRLLSHTEHRSHTALVFESLSMNLREALKKYGKHVGINISAVRTYAKQLLLALRHLHKLRIVHADIKPDNILVSENNAVLKLCDFGSAFRESDPGCSDPSPYLVSRFYRAPEIILGLKYDTRVDLWSIATCLYELYTGHIMYAGVDNNNMLRLMMELKGRFPVKMLKAHARSYTDLLLLDPHFVEVGSTFKFQHRVMDERTGEPRLTLVDVVKATRSIANFFLEKKAGADDKRVVLDLADFLEQTCMLNPDNRPSILECLKHRFVAGRETHPKDKEGAPKAPAPAPAAS